MAKMAKQMELFDEGGLMDEGGTTDPVSGNDVPPGSTQEEVRDDIPAQLSEGEFVVPADVVRYVGLENLMRMRQEAKQGLAEMEAMGQMGNSEEATMPDNLPFNEYDLDIEDDGLEMNVGGYVPPSINPMTGVYPTGTSGIAGFQNYQNQQTGFTPYGGPAPFFQPTQFTGPQYTTALQTTNLPTFSETLGGNLGKYDELIKYQNAAGQILQIPFKNGQPIYPVPQGYSKAPDEPKEETTTSETTVTPIMGQTQTRQDTGDGREDPSVFISGQTKKDFEEGKEASKDRFAISGRRGLDLVSMVPGGNFVRELLGIPEIAPMFQKDPESLPTQLGGPSAPFGPKDLSQLPTVGKPSESISQTVKQGSLPSPTGSLIQLPKDFAGLLPADVRVARNLRALRTQLGVDPTRYASLGSNNRAGDFDPSSGGFFNKQGIAVNPDTGDAARTSNGSMSYKSLAEYRESIIAGSESGWRGGQVGRDKFGKLSLEQQSRYNDFAKRMGLEKDGTRSVDQIKDDQREAANKEAAEAARAAPFDPSNPAGTSPTVRDSAVDSKDKGGDGAFGGLSDRQADAAKGSKTESGKSIGGNPGDKSRFKSGGLAKQMKRSGLASKK
tara:strand:- start:6019 stop:7851 length:1833 start_codon:yes stop_codon:yes gene_type:complete